MGTWQEFIPWNASAPVAAGAKARVIIPALWGVSHTYKALYKNGELLLLLLLLLNSSCFKAPIVFLFYLLFVARPLETRSSSPRCGAARSGVTSSITPWSCETTPQNLWQIKDWHWLGQADGGRAAGGAQRSVRGQKVRGQHWVQLQAHFLITFYTLEVWRHTSSLDTNFPHCCFTCFIVRIHTFSIAIM